ncbi:MAG: YcaO-like family protein [Pirellulales bacterium]
MNGRDGVNPFTGFLATAGPVPLEAYDPEVAIWSGRLSSWRNHLGSGSVRARSVGGAGWTDIEAEQACWGEAAERWRAAPTPLDQRIAARFDDWPGEEPCIEPERWVLFHPAQYDRLEFPFQPLTRRTLVRWVAMREALTGEPHWVPEELVYLDLSDDDAHRCTPGLSTGLAAGSADYPVVLRGLQEVVERDAVVGAWWGRYRISPVDPADVWRWFDDDQRRAVQRPNLTYHFYQVATPWSAHAGVVVLTGEDRSSWLLSAGSAVRETRAALWHKAVLEAIHSRHLVRFLTRAPSAATTVDRDPPGSSAPLFPRSFEEHAVYYCRYPAQWADTPFARATALFDGACDDDTCEGLPVLAERLGSRHPVLVRLLTPPALAPEWQVVRVLVPGLQPLHGRHDWPFLGGPLWAPRSPDDWSSVLPHPFP